MQERTKGRYFGDDEREEKQEKLRNGGYEMNKEKKVK